MHGESVLDPTLQMSMWPIPAPSTLSPTVALTYIGAIRRFANRKESFYFDAEFYHRSRNFLPAEMDLSSYLPAAVSDEALFKNFKKYDVIPPAIDPVALSMASHYLEGKLRQAGVVNCEIIELMPAIFLSKTGTGPGLPHSLYNQTRLDLLGSSEFFASVRAQWQRWTSGSPVVSMSSGVLKQELRDRERVRALKTREFNIVPFETILNGKRLVHDFTEKFFDACANFDLPVFGGEDTLALWPKLYKHLLKFDITLDADFSSWDSRLWCPLMLAFYKVRFNLLKRSQQTEANRNALISLCREIMESYVALDTGHVFKKLHGNLTGQPSTFVDNSCVNLLAFYYIVFVNYGPDGYRVLESVSPYVCGDDLIVAGSNEYKHDLIERLPDHYSNHLKFVCETRGINDSLSSLNFISAKFLRVGNKVLIDRDPAKVLAGLFLVDTDVSFTTRLMKIDAAKANLLAYPALLNALDKMYEQEVLLFGKANAANPEYTLYSSPSVNDLLAKCEL